MGHQIKEARMHTETEKSPCRSGTGKALRHGWPAAGREARGGEGAASFGGLRNWTKHVWTQLMSRDARNALDDKNPFGRNDPPLKHCLRGEIELPSYRARSTCNGSRLLEGFTC